MSFYTKDIKFIRNNENDVVYEITQGTSNSLQFIGPKNALFNEFKEQIDPQFYAKTIINELSSALDFSTYDLFSASRNKIGETFYCINSVRAITAFNVVDGNSTYLVPLSGVSSADDGYIFKFDKDYKYKWSIKNHIRMPNQAAIYTEAHAIPDNNGGILVVSNYQNVLSSVTIFRVYSADNSYISIERPNSSFSTQHITIVSHIDANGIVSYAFAVAFDGMYTLPQICGQIFQDNGDIVLALSNTTYVNQPLTGNVGKLTFDGTSNIAFISISISSKIISKVCNINLNKNSLNASRYALTKGHDGGMMFTFAISPDIYSFTPTIIAFNDSNGLLFQNITLNETIYGVVQLVCKFNNTFSSIDWYTIIKNNGNSRFSWMNVFTDFNGYVIQNGTGGVNTNIHQIIYSDGSSTTIPNDIGYPNWDNSVIGDGLFLKLDKFGKLVWRYNLSSSRATNFYQYDPQVCFCKNNVLFVLSDGRNNNWEWAINCIDTETGAVKYYFPLQGDFDNRFYQLLPIEYDFAFLDVIGSSYPGSFSSITIPKYLETPLVVTLPRSFIRDITLNIDFKKTVSFGDSTLESASLTTNSISVSNAIIGGTYYGNVATTSIANDSITTAKLANNAITNSKIASNVVTFDKLLLNELAQVKIPVRSNFPIVSDAVIDAIEMNDGTYSQMFSSVGNYGNNFHIATTVQDFHGSNTKIYGYSNNVALDLSSSNLVVLQTLSNNVIIPGATILVNPYMTGVLSNNIIPIYSTLYDQHPLISSLYSLPNTNYSYSCNITFSGTSGETKLIYPYNIDSNNSGVINPIYNIYDGSIKGVFGFYGSNITHIGFGNFGGIITIHGFEHNYPPLASDFSFSDTFGNHNITISMSNIYAQTYVFGNTIFAQNVSNGSSEYKYNHNKHITYKSIAAVSLSNVLLRRDTAKVFQNTTNWSGSNISACILTPFNFIKSSSQSNFSVNIETTTGTVASMDGHFVENTSNAYIIGVSKFNCVVGTSNSSTSVLDLTHTWTSYVRSIYDSNTFDYDWIANAENQGIYLYVTSKNDVVVTYSNEVNTVLSNVTPGYANSHIISFDSNGHYAWSVNLGKETNVIRSHKPVFAFSNCLMAINSKITFLDKQTGSLICPQISNTYTDTYTSFIPSASNFVSVIGKSAGYNSAMPFYADVMKPKGLRLSSIKTSNKQVTSLLTQATIVSNEDISTSKAVISNQVISNSLLVNSDCTLKGSVYNLSDARVKQNISPISDALEKINKLSGYTYERKDQGKKLAGVIAQEVNEVLPEAIGSDGEYMTVSYDAMISLLIQAVKELHQKVKNP